MPIAATVVFSESNLAGEIVTENVGNLNFGSADQPELIPINRPLVVPGASHGNTVSSYPKYFRAQLTSLGDSNSLTNFIFWKSAGAFIAGESIRANCDDFDIGGGQSRFFRITWHTPSPFDGIIGAPAWFGLNVGITGPRKNVGIDVTGTPDNGTNCTVSGSLTVASVANPPALGSVTQYIALAMLITNATPISTVTPVNQKTFTLAWDES